MTSDPRPAVLSPGLLGLPIPVVARALAQCHLISWRAVAGEGSSEDAVPMYQEEPAIC